LKAVDELIQMKECNQFSVRNSKIPVAIKAKINKRKKLLSTYKRDKNPMRNG
jgi:hypothetical protein